ncbi:MAG TPA: hypothetical protein PK208_06060 [Fibrobacteria bacterium]|nr:hypothetical protein [Fibrobacteria bacterium]
MNIPSLKFPELSSLNALSKVLFIPLTCACIVQLWGTNLGWPNFILSMTIGLLVSGLVLAWLAGAVNSIGGILVLTVSAFTLITVGLIVIANPAIVAIKLPFFFPYASLGWGFVLLSLGDGIESRSKPN